MMVVWLRPEYILAFVTSLYYCSQIVLSKTYDKFLCATEEGHHQISCPDETALLTDISIRKVHRRTEMCEPDDHSEYLVNCQSFIDGSLCEGNKTCSIEISSRDYIQCGEKKYTPTYFFVKYTCTQIHTLCTDSGPIRNTLYGYIVSPAYPHPMADNLRCSISIEADPSMYIELSPVQIHLQEAFKCRSEYLEIFGYDSTFDENNSDKNHNWKGYHTWCGTERSSNNPLSNARYLIPSNSLYMSLQTGVSKKSRFIKIRYKVVPPIGRSQYNSDGVAFDSQGHVPSVIPFKSSTVVIPTTIVLSSLNNSDVKNLTGKLTKTSKKKVILIGTIGGAVLLLIAITVGVLVFIFMKRRRSSTSGAGKKNTPATPSTTTSKSTAKSSDKAPLLEQTNKASAAAAAKPKLVPERTVQVPSGGPAKPKSGEPTGPKTGSTKPEPSVSRPALTAADSGIYGADLSEEAPTPTKPVSSPPPLASSVSAPPPVSSPPPPLAPSASEPPKIYGIDLPDVSEPKPNVVVNPLPENSTISAIVLSDNVETTPLSSTIENEEKQTLLDNTIQSAYPHLIDATTSENEGTICGSSLHSRRTSNITPTLSSNHEFATIVISEQSEYNTIPFNPLHVILKKDANKYYTTEYI